MNKIIVLHDTVNGKRRVVIVNPPAWETEACDACRACDIANRKDVFYPCELSLRFGRWPDHLFGESPVCGFRDVFEPEDL